MDEPETAPVAPSESVSLPVRVPMEKFFNTLKGLVSAAGPFVTLYLPIHDDDARNASLAAVMAADGLSADQQAFGRSLLDSDRVADDAMIVGFLAADGTSLVQSFPEGPAAPLVERGALPRLAPIIEAEQRLRHHVLAVVSTDGVDILTVPRHGRATLHRAAPGDPAYVALLITEAAKQTETPLVLVAAEPGLAEDLAERISLDVPIETRVRVLPVDGGLDALAEDAVQSVATDRAVEAVNTIRTWRFERSHGLGAGGVQATLRSLRSDDLRMVLVTDHVDDHRQAWFGSHPTAVAMDLEDANLADEISGDLTPARLVDVVLRSALLRDVPVTVVPDLPEETLRDGIGVIRSAADDQQ